MAYELSERLVIGVSSSALFDLSESDAIYQTRPLDEYRRFQSENAELPLEPGVSFQFIKKLLQLNNLRPTDPLVEVVVMSRNSPETGIRVMNSIASHELHITRSAFTGGRSPYEYIDSFDMCLFLSGNVIDVKSAISAGYPAGLVMPGAIGAENDQDLVLIAFDFDAVLSDDGSERVFHESNDLTKFKNHEVVNKNVPHAPGPLKIFLEKLNEIQKIEKEYKEANEGYVPRLRIALVTARNAPAHERPLNTLKAWGLEVDEAYFMGGVKKSKVLNVMKPLIFFDDQTGHLEDLDGVAAIHIPFGIKNTVETNEP